MSLFSTLFPTQDKAIKQLTMKLNEAIEALGATKTQLTKVVGEVRGVQTEVNTLKDKVKALEEAAANGDIPQELADAITGVKDQTQVVDDTIPDLTEVAVEEQPQG